MAYGDSSTPATGNQLFYLNKLGGIAALTEAAGEGEYITIEKASPILDRLFAENPRKTKAA